MTLAAGCKNDGDQQSQQAAQTAPATTTTSTAPTTAAPATTAPSTSAKAPDTKAATKGEKGGKVVTTASGLKYEDLVVGSGPSPKAGQQVTVRYVGTLEDGTKFDASADHGDGTFSFPIGAGQVIPGWDEGVMSMKVGGKRKLIVPPNLGYGANGMPPVIPPNSTLIFTVDLVKIQ